MPKKGPSREERTWLAVNWLAPLRQSERKPRSHENLADDFAAIYGRRISPKAVAQAIQQAFSERLISVTQNLAPADYRENKVLARRLCQQFSRLRAAIVVDSVNPTTDDESHIQAGYALADHIMAAMPFRNGDRIGIGSGRGVYYTVEALRASGKNLSLPDDRDRIQPPESEFGVVILSLMGSLFPYSTRKQEEVLFDSDITVARFAQCFDSLVHVRPVSYPIALPADDKLKIIERTWLGSVNYPSMVPTHCIVGMGLLNENHRFWKSIRAREKTPTILDPIRQQLDTLVEYIDLVRKRYPDYWPVGDVCGRMFLVTPPDDIRFPQDQVLITEKIQKLVDDLNKHLLTVTKTQLGKVMRSVMLVAPTKLKAAGLHTLLMHPHLRVDVVVTDAAGATALLRMDRRRAQRNP